MRLDVPQELPRRRTPEGTRSAPPLEPSPVERRREHLADRADNRRSRQGQSVTQDRPLRPGRSREPEQRAIVQDRQVDQRPRRQAIPQQLVGLSLRAEERKILAEVGRFRVIGTRDLAEPVYGNRHSRMERDLAFLREKGLVQVDSVNARRDGRGGRVERIEVVTLTKSGRDVARQTSGLPQNQRLYAGLVKPREAEHDAQIYRAYRKEAERIEQRGGTNLRVQLDFELKSNVQKAIHAARKAEPDRDMAEIKQQVARQFELPYVNDGIQIPDARIEYDLDRKADQDTDQGSHSGHEDIEVLTAAYRPGHLRAKAQAGFHVYPHY
jgi:DNA-binding transcriptional ArsR family regulator